MLVNGEICYHPDISTFKKVLKPSIKVREFELPFLLPGIPLNISKINDMKKVLYLQFGENWENNPELRFYQNRIFESTALKLWLELHS